MKNTIQNVLELELTQQGHTGGALIPIENSKEIPFDIARIFYVFGVPPKEERGHHAHIQCAQFLLCLHGRCLVECDDSEEKKTYNLDHPSKGLLVPPGIWAKQKYVDKDTVLLVLTDRPYETEDYIRNYEDFLSFRKKLLEK